ncbi:MULTISPECIES: HNH endonuclease [unclassified Niallia]|uniref:HNH endonuclease n=1 Tax=unclassified Niallia TaxID=2837522 RepID=UPI00203FAC6D|nr:HNH endonuclease [Niallia sp. MER 6]MCM3030376.1 HNH endonuclease [Niallia sp. MER 6]
MPLTLEQKEQIKKLRLSGNGYVAIANELKVKRDQVRSFCRLNNLDGERGKRNTKEKIFLITCNNCGNTKRMNSTKAKFCSDSCRRKYNGKHRGHDQTCKQCGKVFKEYIKRSHCSIECRTKHELEQRKERNLLSDMNRKDKEIVRLVNTLNLISSRIRFCSYCGNQYILKKNETGFKYCSEECKCEGYKKNRRINNRKRRINKDKRLNKNGKINYSITLDKLYERDKGVCHLCNEYVDYNDFIVTNEDYFIAGNRYPSIDHVIPIANGGLHQWDNVKLAHRQCNSIKQDKVIES